MAEPAPSIHVGSLALGLPGGFERRAVHIGRLTAEALAAAPPAVREAHLPLVRLAPQAIRPHWSDRRIAFELARAIRMKIEGF